MEHLGSLEGLSRGRLQHCFLWQYQVIYHHFSYILFTATLLKNANIDFSKDCWTDFLNSSTTLSRADGTSHWKNVMNRKTLLLWLHSSPCPARTPPLLLRFSSEMLFVTSFCSLLSCKLPHSNKVWGFSLGKGVTSWASWMLSLLPCGTAAGLYILHSHYSSLVSPSVSTAL